MLAAAKKAGKSYSLDIFGDGPLRAELTELSRSLGLEGQVRFQGFRTDVRDQLPGYRAYVHAAYAETSSLAIIEAMAAGLPIVAGPIGPLPELYDEGVEGRFWPSDNPAGAATILMELLESESVMREASQAAAKRFRREFDASVTAPKLWSFVSGGTGR